MITREEVLEAIAESIADILEVDKVELDEDKIFYSDLGLDSLDVFEIGVNLEKKFKVVLDSYTSVSSVRSLIDDVMTQVDKCNKCSTPYLG